MKVEQLYEALKKSQEAKGIYFNKDRDLVFELLESLLLNKDTDTWPAPADWPAETGTMTRTLSAPVTIASRIWKNSGPVFADYMCPRH